MTGLVNSARVILAGKGAVGPTGPQLPTDGILGSGGKIDLGKLSEGLNLGSAALKLFSANEAAKAGTAAAAQQARSLLLSAEDDAIEARREEIRGKQESNDIMDRLLRTVASQRLAAAANGVDIDFGTVPALAENARDLAATQLSIAREDAQVRSLSRQRQAVERRIEAANVVSGAKSKARATKIAGAAGAIGTLAELAQRRKERG